LRKKRLLIVDQLNLFFRSYIVDPSLSSNGQPIGGLKGTLKALQKIVRETNPDQVIICWDGEGGSARRKIINKKYKEGRKPPRLNRDIRVLSEAEEAENKIWQMEQLVKYYNNMPTVQFMFRGVEADDIIAYVNQLPHYKDWQKVIISNDKDFYQLLDDTTIVYRPAQKEIVNKNIILDRSSVHPRNYVLARAMEGDKSDNLDGVPRIGLKTVKNIFPFLSEEKDYTIDDILNYSKSMLSESKKKAYSTILEHEHIIRRNYKMMQLASPMMPIQAKKDVRRTIEESIPEFNKTELIKMMIQDGFGDWNWSDLQVHFRKMVVDH